MDMKYSKNSNLQQSQKDVEICVSMRPREYSEERDAAYDAKNFLLQPGAISFLAVCSEDCQGYDEAYQGSHS